MDLLQEFPRNEAWEAIQSPAVAAFGITLQGASHRKSTPPAPCQDAHALCWMEDEGIFLAAIADGVGSCKLSHWGAYTAVNAALTSVREALSDLAGGKRLRLDAESGEFRKQMKEIMVSAFRAAQDAVERLADDAEPPQMVFALQSTLTLAIYDGKCLYHGHAGDDGIVAQLPDGTVEMATRWMKGEEASSVYPLQSGEKAWSFGLVPEVAGFVMATDGVLDAFVQSHPDYYGINYYNGICYAFMEDAMQQLARPDGDAAGAAMEQYLTFMQSEEYTQRVTDDLTLVAAVSPALMAKSKQPEFNLEIWNTIAQESMNAKRRALNHRAAQEAEPMVQMPTLPAEPEAALPQEEPADPGEDAPFFPQPQRMRGRRKRSSDKGSPWRFWPW
ncbi:MAG: protein phosphatase 2C domain-containing protein [Aristaeellaceae bacterium]